MLKDKIELLISKYQEKVENEKNIRNPEHMPSKYDRMRSIDRQCAYEKVVLDLKETIVE